MLLILGRPKHSVLYIALPHAVNGMCVYYGSITSCEDPTGAAREMFSYKLFTCEECEAAGT